MDWVLAVKRRGFAIKLGVLAALILLFDFLFWQQRFGLGNLGFYGLALLAGLVIVRPATLKSAQGITAVLAGAIYCAAVFLHGSLLSMALFWTAITIAALAPFATHLKDGWQWFGRLVLHGFVSPFMPLVDAGRLSKVAKRSRPKTVNVRAAFGLLALPIIGGGIFLALFIEANPVLEAYLGAWKLPEIDLELAIRIIVWGMIAVLIWTLFRPYRRRGPRLVGTTSATAMPAAFGLPSLASIILSLIVFNALFLMQNGMDIAFMSGLVPLPLKMTLASYAHRGAYPLIVTALLAGLFVVVMLRPGSEAGSNKLSRLLVSAWIVQNVVLVISSMLRTWDYIEAYNMTQLRLAALAWMVLVGVGLALICWRLLMSKSGSWLINANLWAVGLMLTGFCFVDTRAVVAQWNVKHAKEVGGRGVELDLCYMNELGSGAIVPLMSLEQKPLPEAFRQRVKWVRQSLQARESGETTSMMWTWNLGRNIAEADELRTKLPALDLGKGDRDCSGAVVTESTETYPDDSGFAPAAPTPYVPPSTDELTQEQTR